MSENQLQASNKKLIIGMKQDDFLNHLITESFYTGIYLINGIRLQGYIIGFDAHVIFFRSNNEDTTMMIYKSAISTITIIKQTRFDNNIVTNKQEMHGSSLLSS